MRRPLVAIIGAGRADRETEAQAQEVGRLLAKAGAHLVCGGLGGVMAAAAAGFQDAAAGMPPGACGLVLGVLPGNSAGDANPGVDIPIVTAMGEARNCIIVNTASACIAIGGEFGTLSEIALALRRGTRVVSLGSWQVHKNITEVASPEEAVRMALSAFERG